MAGGHRRAFQEVLAQALAAPDARLAITGATGWLGMALADMASSAGLTTANGRLRLFASSARTVTLSGGVQAQVETLIGAEPLSGPGWRVAHFAGHGKERTLDLSPDEFAVQGDAILAAALALTEHADRPHVAFSSSGAVYAPAGGLVERLQDSPYGYLKHQHEARLQDWCGRRALPLLVVRVFNIGGPHGNKRSGYALSSLVDTALAGRPLVVRAERPVLRSYVHVEELMALMAALLDGEDADGRPFDTAGPETVEVGVLAERVRAVLGRPELEDSDGPRPDLPEDRYVGDGRIYRARSRPWA